MVSKPFLILGMKNHFAYVLNVARRIVRFNIDTDPTVDSDRTRNPLTRMGEAKREITKLAVKKQGGISGPLRDLDFIRWQIRNA